MDKNIYGRKIKLIPEGEKDTTKIILLFLEKLEKFNDEERREILKVIKWINNPMYITNK